MGMPSRHIVRFSFRLAAGPAHFCRLRSVLSMSALDSTVLLRKARVLSLVELASEYVGGRMSYDQVAKCLELEFGSEDDEEDKNMEIEGWVIEGENFQKSPVRRRI